MAFKKAMQTNLAAHKEATSHYSLAEIIAVSAV